MAGSNHLFRLNSTMLVVDSISAAIEKPLGRPGGIHCARANEGQFKGTTPDAECNLEHRNNTNLLAKKSCSQTVSGCSCGVNPAPCELTC
jgi:hypothetical protein